MAPGCVPPHREWCSYTVLQHTPSSLLAPTGLPCQPGWGTDILNPSPSLFCHGTGLSDEPLRFLKGFSERTIHSPAAGPRPWIWSFTGAKLAPWAWASVVTQ